MTGFWFKTISMSNNKRADDSAVDGVSLDELWIDAGPPIRYNLCWSNDPNRSVWQAGNPINEGWARHRMGRLDATAAVAMTKQLDGMVGLIGSTLPATQTDLAWVEAIRGLFNGSVIETEWVKRGISPEQVPGVLLNLLNKIDALSRSFSESSSENRAPFLPFVLDIVGPQGGSTAGSRQHQGVESVVRAAVLHAIFLDLSAGIRGTALLGGHQSSGQFWYSQFVDRTIRYLEMDAFPSTYAGLINQEIGHYRRLGLREMGRARPPIALVLSRSEKLESRTLSAAENQRLNDHMAPFRIVHYLNQRFGAWPVGMSKVLHLLADQTPEVGRVGGFDRLTQLSTTAALLAQLGWLVPAGDSKHPIDGSLAATLAMIVDHVSVYPVDCFETGFATISDAIAHAPATPVTQWVQAALGIAYRRHGGAWSGHLPLTPCSDAAQIEWGVALISNFFENRWLRPFAVVMVDGITRDCPNHVSDLAWAGLWRLSQRDTTVGQMVLDWSDRILEGRGSASNSTRYPLDSRLLDGALGALLMGPEGSATKIWNILNRLTTLGWVSVWPTLETGLATVTHRAKHAEWSPLVTDMLIDALSRHAHLLSAPVKTHLLIQLVELATANTEPREALGRDAGRFPRDPNLVMGLIGYHRTARESRPDYDGSLVVQVASAMVYAYPPPVLAQYVLLLDDALMNGCDPSVLAPAIPRILAYLRGGTGFESARVVVKAADYFLNHFVTTPVEGFQDGALMSVVQSMADALDGSLDGLGLDPVWLSELIDRVIAMAAADPQLRPAVMRLIQSDAYPPVCLSREPVFDVVVNSLLTPGSSGSARLANKLAHAGFGVPDYFVNALQGDYEMMAATIRFLFLDRLSTQSMDDFRRGLLGVWGHLIRIQDHDRVRAGATIVVACINSDTSLSPRPPASKPAGPKKGGRSAVYKTRSATG